MSITRRQLLWGGAALLGGSLLGSPFGLAQDQNQKRLIVLMARGGWDPVVALDPKEEGPGVSIPPGSLFRRGDLALYDAEATAGVVPRYFAQHGDVTAIVRGLTVASVAHEACTRRILTGTLSAASPDIGAISAAMGGSDSPLPYMVLGASAFSGPFSAQSGRVGTSNQLVTLLDPAKHFPIEGKPGGPFVKNQDESSAVQAFLQGRAERLRQRVGRHGNNARRLNDYRASLDSSQRLGSFSDALGDVASSVELTRQVDTVLDMMEQEVIWSASLDTGVSWDTHTNSHAAQTANTIILFEGLSQLIDGLKSRPGSRGGRLIDETAVVVLSEMGRTPMLNAQNGKDHWQVSNAMLIGSDIPGEQVYGKSTDTGDPRGVLQAEPVDFATGQPSTNGRMLESTEFVAGVLSWVGSDPTQFLPNTTPFMPWVRTAE